MDARPHVRMSVCVCMCVCSGVFLVRNRGAGGICLACAERRDNRAVKTVRRELTHHPCLPLSTTGGRMRARGQANRTGGCREAGMDGSWHRPLQGAV